MKTQLTIQEKLKDLRVERGLTLEQLAAQVDISRSALGAYESNDYKDISHTNLMQLARFYGVSADYLLGLTDNREQVNAELAELHLDDATVELLKSGRINNRLLCEIIKHPDFATLMADAEIYVDGIATMQINNMNDWLDAARTEIIQKANPDENDLYLRLLEKSKIKEEEYFFHVTHEDWDGILRDIRKDHAGDVENAPTDGDTRISQKLLRSYQDTMRLKLHPEEQVWRYFCDQMQIDYDKLDPAEHEAMHRVLKKSKLLRTFPSHRHKRRS